MNISRDTVEPRYLHVYLVRCIAQAGNGNGKFSYLAIDTEGTLYRQDFSSN